MSPEQAAGRRGAITTATDVYGLGAILYALLTGKAPFGGDSVIETLDAVRTRPPEPPTKRNAKVPRDLELICLKCLEKNPADRYPTAEALADDLRRWAAGEPVSVRAAGAVERVAKWARRKPTLAAAYTLGLLALLLGGLGGAAVWQWRAAATGRVMSRRRPRTSAPKGAGRRGDGQGGRRKGSRRRGRQAREELARVEYGRTMEVAHQEWRENNVAAAAGLAREHPARPPRLGVALRPSPLPFRPAHPQGAHRLRHFGVVQPRRLADRHRAVTTRRRRSGTPGPAPSSSRSRGTPVASSRRRSARTGRGSSPRAGTRRRRSGTPRPAPRSSRSRGTTDRSRSASFSPDGSRIVTAQRRQDGEGLGRQDRRRGPHPQGAHRWRRSRRRSAPTGRGSSPRVGTGRRRSGTPGPAPRSSPSRGTPVAVTSASFSPDGSRIVTASHDRTAKVWDAKTGAELLTLKGHTGRRHFGVVQPGRVAGRHRELTTGRRRSGTPRPAPRSSPSRGTPTAVMSASFSPDGSRIVTASWDRTAKVWDARTGAEVLTLKGHTDARHFGVVQPGRVADRHRESTTGRRRSGTPGPAPRSSRSRGTPVGVTSASFSPDGSRIVTASWDKTAKVWDAKTRRRDPHAQGAHRLRHLGVVQPGRVADRHRESRQDGEGLGRQDRRRGPHAQGAHRRRPFGVVQPRRVADRHRERGQDGEGLGRAGPAPSSSRSRGTPVTSLRRRSARTGRAIVTGESGQDGEGLGREDRRRGPHPQGTTLRVRTSTRLGVVQPGRVADRHREWGRDGEGLGRQDGRRGPHAQGARTVVASARRRSARTGRGSSPSGTRRRGSGTPRRSTGSSWVANPPLQREQ